MLSGAGSTRCSCRRSGSYLHRKDERQQFDDMFDYARASLLHYARWMAAHERPYLGHPEILEYKTETWAAQDMRKAEVFQWAAMHADGVERGDLHGTGRILLRVFVDTLAGMPGRHFTRPIVLMLSNGARAGWMRTHGPAICDPSRPLATDWEAFRQFTLQKLIAFRRAKWLALATIAGGFLLWMIL